MGDGTILDIILKKIEIRLLKTCLIKVMLYFALWKYIRNGN